jgi:hypothetical protein
VVTESEQNQHLFKMAVYSVASLHISYFAEWVCKTLLSISECKDHFSLRVVIVVSSPKYV